MAPKLMTPASRVIFFRSDGVTIGSWESLGGRSNTSSAGASSDSASPGKMSLMRLIQSNCIPVRGCPMPPMLAVSVTIISLRFVASRKWSDFRTLSYMVLPWLTATIMVSMLSFSRTTSATSLATSVPVSPMATPIFAAFKAGLSFIPSPVMATTLPAPCKPCTICSLCPGLTLANTWAC